MKNQKILIPIITLILWFSLMSLSYSYEITSKSIYNHIEVLAHDSLEGRQVGEEGGLKAALYIKSVFEKYNLTPKGDNNSYFQEFDFVKQIDFGPKNRLAVNGQDLELEVDFFPFKQSASIAFDFSEIVNVDYGIVVSEDDGDYNDYDDKDVKGKAVLIKRYSPSSEDNPHIDFDKYNSLADKIKSAIDNEAGGIIFITPSDHDDTLDQISIVNIYPKEIPIIFLKRTAIEKLNLDIDAPQLESATGETELIKTRDTTRNVIGLLKGKTDTTVIIGAHYDHIGWGGPSSLYAGKEKMIHNGADDNASGVSALLELAALYADSENQMNYSMLFITFAGEEFGLLGSSQFTNNMTIDSSKVRMMINMDMIGRLNEQKNGLAILGTGTCEEFKTYFDSLNYEDLHLSIKESGTGPSDHTPFYNRKIPVLNFFTGAHSDYHKPSDDADKIDTEGVVKVTRLISDIINYFDKYDGALNFQKTKDESEGKRRAKYSVTLGIMPDYIAEVKGLRISGVMEDRPGGNAGMLEGDIVIKMGDIIISDIYDYMNALGKFRKGDSVMVDILRSADTLSLEVVF